jgi:ABC-type nickel/cobalt efflux system permease component RcnA
MRALLLSFLLIAAIALLGEAGTAQQADSPSAPAQTQPKIDKRKLLVQPRNAGGAVQQISFWEDPVLWVRDQQQSFYGAMSGAIRKMRGSSTYAATWTLLFLSFGYGVFHAAGPGHGKAVISAWLLATENELKRGVFIAFLSSIVQALTAIAIVSALLLIVASVGATARNVAGFLESASYGLIGIMGLYLIWTAFRPQAHAHGYPREKDGLYSDFVPLHNHSVAHNHDETCACGHAHVPEAKAVRGDWSLAKAFSLAFAVGIRPCTGAILVLIFANALGLYWAGVASTLTMAMGTFLTVSAIAALAVYSKKIAMRLAARETRWLDWTAFGLRLGAGFAIACLGGLLFWGSLGTVNAMM